jgi:hypothetical protein
MDDKIGALWEKVKNDKKYFTGSIEIDGKKIPIVVFSNNKTKDTQPDWNILKSKPRESMQSADFNDSIPEF